MEISQGDCEWLVRDMRQAVIAFLSLFPSVLESQRGWTKEAPPSSMAVRKAASLDCPVATSYW